MKEIRALLQDWRDWRTGAVATTPEVECIEAVYQSELMPPTLRDTITLVYLDPRDAKRKYRSISPTVYYERRKVAEELVAHLAKLLAPKVPEEG